eukprot:TRINITY_DN4604_c0_g1_i3.p1 TRINITY_DN4604_c0_g1~~TRINITY_DN4604_c0_g1_i3.p1  ORF type:complete len:404 (+),score=118.72 TRINITY_DN4604_c0_g1_i3:82-1293(+)
MQRVVLITTLLLPAATTLVSRTRNHGDSGVVHFGPGSCVSAWVGTGKHCVVKTSCSKQPAFDSYALRLICVDKDGGRVLHGFEQGGFDPEETFDTLIVCDKCEAGDVDTVPQVFLAREAAENTAEASTMTAETGEKAPDADAEERKSSEEERDDEPSRENQKMAAKRKSSEEERDDEPSRENQKMAAKRKSSEEERDDEIPRESRATAVKRKSSEEREDDEVELKTFSGRVASRPAAAPMAAPAAAPVDAPSGLSPAPAMQPGLAATDAKLTLLEKEVEELSEDALTISQAVAQIKTKVLSPAPRLRGLGAPSPAPAPAAILSSSPVGAEFQEKTKETKADVKKKVTAKSVESEDKKQGGRMAPNGDGSDETKLLLRSTDSSKESKLDDEALLGLLFDGGDGQ